MDKELIAVLQLLSNRSFVTAQELEEETKASKRQITYRMAKINDLLQARKVATIPFAYQKDIIIASETRQEIIRLLQSQQRDKVYYFSKEERLSYIFLTMFLYRDYLSLSDFVDDLQVSRSTILSDIKEASGMLQSSQIKIKNDRTYGYYLYGSEMDIRKYMMQVIIMSVANEESQRVFHTIIDKYHLDTFHEAKKIIGNVAVKYSISFVEDRLVEFVYILIFLKTRMVAQKDGRGKIASLPEMPAMFDMKEYLFSSELLANFEQGKQLSTNDISYIAAWILGISIGNVQEDTRDSNVIRDMVNKILIRFESLSGFHYREYDDIFKQLYSHFRPAYYRLLFHLPIFNPLCSRVKEEYRELYRLVSESMKPFVALFQEEIPEDELAYLTVHFASIFSNEREGIALSKKTALVVCSNGIGSSAILYAELTNMFPDIHFLLPIEAGKMEDVKEQVDIIFTTSLGGELIHAKAPVLKVHPVMTSKEKYQITREVYRHMGNTFLKQPQVDDILDIVMKYSDVKNKEMLRETLTSYFYRVEKISDVESEKGVRLCDITKESLVRLQVQATTMEEAIRKSAQPLRTEGYATQEYIDAMVETVKESGAYIVITTHVALPHARPERGALNIGISITTLKEPVVFGNLENDPVKYVFCLSAVDNERHIHAMAELMDLLERDDFYQILDRAENAHDIIGYIKEHEA